MPLSEYTGQKVRFDVSIPLTVTETSQGVLKAAKPIFKHFTFQEEPYPTTPDVHHWQFRGSLHNKATRSKVLTDLIPKFRGHWSLTSKCVHSTNDFNYVMDETKRVPGTPVFTDKTLIENKPKTTQLAIFEKHLEEHGFFPYQQFLLDRLEEFDMRRIVLVYDPAGNNWKSLFTEYLDYYDMVFEIPPLRNIADIMQFCMSFKPYKAYVVDLPRGMKKDKLGEFYAGLECVKNGYFYDIRYDGKRRRQSRPHVIVFTNTLPSFDLMTPDRWDVFQLNPSDKTLTQMRHCSSCSTFKVDPTQADDEPTDLPASDPPIRLSDQSGSPSENKRRAIATALQRAAPLAE